MENYLNDIEKAEVQKFIENKTLLEAVRKVILAAVYHNGTLKPGEPAEADVNFALSITGPMEQVLSNEEIGARIRGKNYAIGLLLQGFNELEKFKKVAENKPKTNPAR